MPVPAVNVPLLVNPFLKATASFAELFHTPPEFTVVAPINVLLPDVLKRLNVPFIIVVPETVMVALPTESVAPLSIFRFKQVEVPLAAYNAPVLIHNVLVFVGVAVALVAPVQVPAVTQTNQFDAVFQLVDAPVL